MLQKGRNGYNNRSRISYTGLNNVGTDIKGKEIIYKRMLP
jgi:hypothetical protein